MANDYENLVYLAFMHYKEVAKWVPTVVVAEEAVSPLVHLLEEKSFSHWITIKNLKFFKKTSFGTSNWPIKSSTKSQFHISTLMRFISKILIMKPTILTGHSLSNFNISIEELYSESDVWITIICLIVPIITLIVVVIYIYIYIYRYRAVCWNAGAL